MTKSSASCPCVVLIECQCCGRHYPFGPVPHSKKISDKEKLREGWHKVKKRFFFLFFKNIMICPICAIEKKFLV